MPRRKNSAKSIENVDQVRAIARAEAEFFLSEKGFREQNKRWIGVLTVAEELKTQFIDIEISLPDRFPDALPIVRVTDRSLPRPFPHVESDNRLCIVQSHAALFDTSRPKDIIRDTLNRATEILYRGMSGESLRDLTREFLAYWERGASSEPVMSLVSTRSVGELGRPLAIARVVSGRSKPRYFIADSAIAINDWCEHRGSHRVEESDRSAYLLKLTTTIQPPDLENPPTADYWLGELEKRVDPKAWIEFQTWLEGECLPAFLAFTLPASDSRPSTLALMDLSAGRTLDQVLQMKIGRRNAHRKARNRVSAYAHFRRAANATIKRARVVRLDAEFLTARGSAAPSMADKRAMVIGCGAIGSHIAVQLAAMGVGRLTLVDPDNLNPENIHRHALGMAATGIAKARALQLHLEMSYPHQVVESFAENFESLVRKNPTIFEDSDVLIFATGDEAMERVAATIFSHKNCIHSWVEPLGVAGHALVSIPSDAIHAYGCYECLFQTDTSKLLHNSANMAAANQEFSVTLAGCAGFHTPFSVIDAQRTALEASKLAIETLIGTRQKSALITWRGDASQFKAAGFVLSPRGKSLNGVVVEVSSDDFADFNCNCCRQYKDVRTTDEAHIANA